MNTALYYRSLGLRLYLCSVRLGGGFVAAAALGSIALACWLWLVPQLQAELDDQQQALQQTEQSVKTADAPIPVAPRPLAEMRAESFYHLLGDRHQIEKQIKALFDLAKEAGLTLQQADYKSIEDKDGDFYTYQIQLPMTGSYSAIRQFCESTLLAMPHVSLDEMSFKRESVGGGKVEAKLRFTFYLSKSPSSATRPSRAKGVAA